LHFTLGGVDVQGLNAIFSLRIDVFQHDVRAKAVHADGGVAGLGQLAIQFFERTLANHQQRKTIGELVRRIDAGCPLLVRQALVLGVEAHQPELLRPAGLRQEIAEPLGGDIAHVVGRTLVVPDGNAHRLLDAVEGHVQRQHAGRPQHHFGVFQLRPYQRHARQLPLRDEHARRIDHHPRPVEFKAGFRQQNFRQVDASARLDGVDDQPGDGGLQVEGSSGHEKSLIAADSR